MLKRGANKGRDNIPVRATLTGRSASAEPEGTLYRGLNENSLKNIASGILGKNENDSRGVRGGGIRTRRAALADKKNMVINEANKKAGKDGGGGATETSRLSLLTNRIRRSFSVSPKRSQPKLLDGSENQPPANRMTLRKGLAELVPRITGAGMRLRSRCIPGANADPSNIGHGKHQQQQQVLVAPPYNETGTDVVQEWTIGKERKPLPYINGKRKTDDHFDNEVIFCDQYADDNWDYLFYIEERGAVQQNFLAGSRVTPKMRMSALDWITGLQVNFNLLPETQLTTVNMFDRCLMHRRFTVDKKQIQLISLGCALVAAKYEEIYPPSMADYLSSCDNTKGELIHAEFEVLNLLCFDLNYPRVRQFMRRLTVYYGIGVHTLAKTIADVATYDYSTCHLKPSVVAAVAVYIAAALEGIEFPEWLHTMARVSKAEADRLAPVFAKSIVDLLQSEKSYGSIYRRMFAHRKLVFSDENIADLTALANQTY